MGTNVTTAFITCPQNEKETLGIKLPFLVMIIKNVSLPLCSSKSTLPLKFKSLMTKMFVVALEHLITSQQLESNHLFVLCQWDSTKAGIRSSSTCQTLHEEHMEAIIFKHYEWPFTQIAEFEESIFRIVFIAKNNFHQNSSSSSPFRSSSDSSYHHTVQIVPWQ